MKKMKILNINKDIKNYTGIENVKPILNYFDNPQDKLKIIHVAGTNGKGSICNYLNNILIENNYKVGLFTSPSVFKSNERFRINNQNISDEKLDEYYLKIEKVAKKLNVKLHEFDKAAILSFLYFKDYNCDFAIIEVGIGGRIDSTNIINKPLVSVIANIGMDHINILGNTLEEIASEKAGIIKKNSLSVFYDQNEIVMNILRKEAVKKNNKFKIVDFSKVEILEKNIDYIKYKYNDYVFKIRMTNDIQVNNSIVALETIFLLESVGYKFDINKIMKGISNTKMLGRFQKINDNPLVIIDGAHNVDSVKALSKTLKSEFENEKFVFIMAFYKDKEYMKLIEIMAPLAYSFLPCQLEDDRFVSSEELSNFVGLFCDRAYNGKTLENSLDIALKHFKDKKIIIYGSLSLIEPSINYFK